RSKRDWSSDVCSSDLDVDSKIDFRYDDPKVKEDLLHAIQLLNDLNLPINQIEIRKLYQPSNIAEDQLFTEEELSDIREERVHFKIGRASCRERVWRSV